MKTDNLNTPGEFGHAKTRGHVGARAGTAGPTFYDQSGNDNTSPDVTAIGFSVSGDSDMTYLTPTGTGLTTTNNSGITLAPGDVVVLETGGTVNTTTTAQDTRPVGVVVLGGLDGDPVSVIFQGYVGFVNVVSSVTEGNYAETSTTAGSAQGNPDRREGSFGYFLSSGTAPSALLFGSPDTRGTDLFLTRGTGEEPELSTVSDAGSTETIDLAGGNWHDITLTANCTIAFSNPPDATGEWTLIIRQGGTGSYTVTWPAEVVWRDADGTQTTTAPTLATAVGASDTVVITTLDGGNSYGASLENGSNGGTATVDVATISALGFVGPILISDSPSTPLVFADLLQNDAQDDLMYADL